MRTLTAGGGNRNEQEVLMASGSDALEGRAILVPALWSVEITNAVLMAERRKRVKQPEIRRFVELLDALTVIMDSQSITETVSNILPIAREYGLSAYDAAYLDVAVRHAVPLATLDSALRKAGRKAGDRDIQGQRCSRVGLFLTRTRGRFPEQHRTFSRHPPALTVSDCFLWPEVRQGRCCWPANRA